MAIRVRRGLKQDFDPNKLLSGELATPLDTRELYAAFAPGDVQKIATYENVQSMVTDATEEVVETLTVGVNAATESAQTATQGANTAGAYATGEGNYAKVQGDYAKAQGDAAANIVHDNIATPTIPGNVRGGGDIVVDQTTGDMTAPAKLDKTGDSKDNIVSFTQAAALANIVSGEKHSTIFGKVMKFLSFIGTTALTTTAQTITGAVNELKNRADTSYSLIGVTSIPAGADLNSAQYRVPGNYYCPTNTEAKTILNPPITPLEAFNLRVYYGTGTGYPVQQIELFSSGLIYRRMYDPFENSGVWKPWIKYLSTSDLTNTDTVNDTTKPLAANVGYALGQELDDIRNGTVVISGEHKFTKGILINGTSYNDTPLQLKANYNLNPNMRAGISFENVGTNAVSLYLDIDGKLKYINNSGNIYTITTT